MRLTDKLLECTCGKKVSGEEKKECRANGCLFAHKTETDRLDMISHKREMADIWDYVHKLKEEQNNG